MKNKGYRDYSWPELIAEFRDRAVQHIGLLDSSDIDSKQVNRNADRLSAIAEELKARAPDFSKVLAELLADPEPAVRMYASAHSEELLPNETLLALQGLKDLPGHIGFSATWRLREFGS